MMTIGFLRGAPRRRRLRVLSGRRGSRLTLLAIAALVAGVTCAPQSVAAAPSVPPSPTVAPSAVPNPDAALGSAWRRSSDVLVTGAGDSNGFHLYVAREKDAFAWSTLATLTASALDLGPWTGEVCVTGSGRYAVATYAPAMAANKPKLMNAGAFAAVVDTTTGKARLVASGVQLAYFNPACGPGDRALLTRAIGDDQQETDLLSVDVAAGTVTATRRIKAQFTNPAPAPDGDYGIVRGALVRVDSTGALTTVAHPQGRPFAVNATARHGIDLASVTGSQAVVERFERGRVTRLGTGAGDRLGLYRLSGGRDAVVGDTSGITGHVPDLTTITSDRQVAAVSAEGHLVAERVVPQQAARAAADPLRRPTQDEAGPVSITVRAAHSGRTSTATVTTGSAPKLNATAPATAGPRLKAPRLSPDAVRPDTNTTNPVCAVPRNDPTVQAFQPSPDMVEWAADQAVHGRLTVQRPYNYLSAGRSGYTPQGMFPLHSLTGGGQVPAQVMLGIVAQESNMSEASWHAVPGDDGNPLIADYYGNGNADINTIDFDKADCGYGISQVTDGMRGSGPPTDKQWAIAVDYAANIAAGLNILIDKWNQIKGDPGGSTWVNDGDPQWVENWFLAVWAYNSGFHPSSEAGANNGHWGVGWLNNPANPAYPPNRHPFLRDGNSGDAAHPGDWPYPERVMGWIETPQLKGSTSGYATPIFGANTPQELTLPGNRTFCGSVNACDPNQNNADPCPADSDACWWHGHATFADCPGKQCARENLSFSLGAAEPGVKRVYDRDCSALDPTIAQGYDPTANGGPLVVYDLNNTQNYAWGCTVGGTSGKFNLRLGDPPGTVTGASYGEIDLHQLGAGYQGHVWFTHQYKDQGEPVPGPPQSYHKIVASWEPSLPLPFGKSQRYDIQVHVPSHGGDAAVDYVVYRDGFDGGTDCRKKQSNYAGKWADLGAYDLRLGARVAANNISGVPDIHGNYPDGTVDVAYDAVAFIPVKGSGSACANEDP